MVDGATSRLTVGTAGVALGSYTMEVVVYHYRGRQKFVPIGRASTQFSITGGCQGWGHGGTRWGHRCSWWPLCPQPNQVPFAVVPGLGV